MVARKRRHDEIEEVQINEPRPEQSLLSKIRNTWEFANLVQYIYIFGKAMKIDEDLDVEDLESECCKPESSKVLSDIGLALLKMVSSHRGLTPELFDEYTKRQYLAKAPYRNPFGLDDEPKKFADFDVFLKLKILVQLSRWTFNNADRIREKMEERGELDQSRAWRITEIGYDRHEGEYYALDDNRLYRLTPAPPPSATPPPKLKKKSKKTKSYGRNVKRRRTRQSEPDADDADLESGNPEETEDAQPPPTEPDDDDSGGTKWECIAITLTDYQQFLDSIAKSRDLNEKALHKTISTDILPIIESAEASQLRKQQKHERELLNLQKLAGAKRSTRIEAKLEREKQERELQEAEMRHKADLEEAEAFKKKQEKLDMDRESRMMTREQRIKEREMKRILHEQELAKMSEDEKRVDAGESRLFERKLKSEMAKRKQELAALEQEDDWTFDCSKCGQFGTNWDDGTHSVACERCSVWQHSACLGISQMEAEKDDFHFICETCKRREEDAKKPKIPSLKFRIGPSASPPDQKPKVMIPALNVTNHADLLHHTVSRHPNHSAKQPISTFNGPPVQVFRPPPSSTNHSEQMKVSAPARQGLHQPFSNGISVQNMPTSSSAQANGHRPPLDTFPTQQNMSNGHSSPAHPAKSHQSPAINTPGQMNGQTAAPPPARPGWSARYVPPPADRQTQSAYGSPSAHQRPTQVLPGAHYPVQMSPRYTDEIRQHPPPPLPTKSVHNMPLPQTPILNATARPESSSATPQVNGFAIQNSPNPHLVGPPSVSPVKHASPPNGHATPFTIDSLATPLSRPPSFPADRIATSPGYSPVKQDSPKMQDVSQVATQAAKITSLPPIAQLVPNTVLPNAAFPKKDLPTTQL